MQLGDAALWIALRVRPDCPSIDEEARSRSVMTSSQGYGRETDSPVTNQNASLLGKAAGMPTCRACDFFLVAFVAARAC